MTYFKQLLLTMLFVLAGLQQAVGQTAADKPKPLLEAVEKRDVAKIRELYKQDPQCLYEYFSRDSLEGAYDSLKFAIKNNDKENVLFELQGAIDINIPKSHDLPISQAIRSGNLDIVTVALNMYTQGIDPQLDFSNLDSISEDFSRLTGMSLHPRAPYAGELIFTAFSGSHQDAIRKAINMRLSGKAPEEWDVPYIPIDPHDIGREYNGIIRINSQSGKGGAAFVLETEFGIIAPKAMHPVIGAVIKARADAMQRELSAEEVYDIFAETWLNTKTPLNVLEITEQHIEGERGTDAPEQVAGKAVVEWEGERFSISANGNGPLDAFVTAMKQTPAPKFNITTFHEHSVGIGSDTQAMAYVQITKEDGQQVWGVGKSSNVGRAGIAAVVSALNFR